MTTGSTAIGFTLAFFLATTPAALAQTAESILVSAETQDFSDQGGSLGSVSLDYKLNFDDTTVVFSPTVGQHRLNGASQTATGLGATVYQDWNDRVSTRTQGFVSEDKPVFARYDFSQDLTVKVAPSTTLTGGFRWAEYFGGREVTFVSLGARRYFKGGSIAYRLTRVNPDDHAAFFGHMANLTLNDRQGKGKTQLWLGAGDSSLGRSQLDENISGKDWAVFAQRTQPLSDRLALVMSAGISSYARPANCVRASTFGLGLLMTIN